MKNVLDWLNLGFTCVFVLEAIIKILAYGKAYFKPNYNKFDFAVVVISIVGLVF